MPYRVPPPGGMGALAAYGWTTTNPARRMHATATGYWGTLGIMIATRSPLPRPRP